ncbi:REP-associated tyrosine transposase [Bremerella alba]|uniref:REP-associated tyrosine transposase n=1 Tax=Bremerella alba TaxID=980252 RepID=A0A7V9A9T9_9BACT|nr:transposase [Bremerella alba]MBA2117787.1 REP-associated tyrosine transposase [Bremerella alba]
MSNYRRVAIGRTVFFTVNTENRRPLLTTLLGRQSLRVAIEKTRVELPFSVIAFVLLPDHLHTIWELPKGSEDFSKRWQKIKATFSKHWKQKGGKIFPVNQSRESRGETGIWQRRFYEHTCRDEDDLKRCVDYIHINPVKHQLVTQAAQWPWSSFHRFVRLGEYDLKWGNSQFWRGDEFRDFD